MKKTKQKKSKTKSKPEINEQQLIDAINEISRKLAYKFRFGYHEVEDMKQQIGIFAIEGLKNYDHERPLENFLWTHVRNRLCNYKRDNYQRLEQPCHSCEHYDKSYQNSLNQCSKFCDKQECSLFRTWFERNNSKKNLMHLNSIDDLKEFIVRKESNQNIESREIINIIDEQICKDMRKLYIKFKNEIKLTKKETNMLLEHIRSLLNEQ